MTKAGDMSHPHPITDISVFERIAQFVNTPCLVSSSWFECKEFRLYLRISWRQLDGQSWQAIDIANVTVKDCYQGQGFYSAILAVCEANTRGFPVYVENVIGEKWQQEMYLRRGYTIRYSSIGAMQGPPSFYKIKEIKNEAS